MIRVRKNGNEIHSVDDWFRFAPPQEAEKQWKDGRSAKELAKAWFPRPGDPAIPSELSELLRSSEEISQIIWEEAEPERVIRFDDCGGNVRNADLVLWGRADEARIVASIEAKADEPFAPRPAGDHVDKCARENPRSRVPERFGLLCEGVLGVDPKHADARALGYQLLTGVAGAACDAQQYAADIVLFIVYGFVGNTDDTKLQANADDLNAFLRLVSKGAFSSILPGQVVGPLSVPGNAHFAGTQSLYIGKCRRDVPVGG